MVPMKLNKNNGMKYFWFAGGFAVGLTMISLGHATVSKPGASVSEIRGGKVASPQFDQEFSNLNSLEKQYAESYDQQQKIRSTTRIARVMPVHKSSKRKSSEE